ncbi:cytochrome c biogenesis protein [Methanolobus sp. ZRKC3]|uniref:cytochrome c biogenesis protein n=1 Tax=Methanolobus sp. ZRKC3 TaxID=3125786 RepID=UPI0032471138
MIKRPVQQQPAIKMSVCRICFLILILSVAAMSAAHADAVELEYFYESGCLKCDRSSPVIEDVVGNYGSINYSNYEITSSFSRAMGYGVTTVPSVVINRTLVIGYADYDGDTEVLRELLVDGIENAPHMPDTTAQDASNAAVSESGFGNGKTPLIIFIAGLLAGFNPCLLAVMAFLASAVVSSNGSRRDMLVLVVGFCAGIFITYMTVGFGILNTIKSFPEIQDVITTIMILLIAFLGLWHIYDAYYMKTHSRSSFKTPRSLIHFMGNIEGKNILFISLLGGGLFSLIKAPCVGAVYLAILESLMSGNDIVQGTMYLGLYNLGVVLPILILGAFLAFGLDPARVNEFKERRRVEIRFVTGMILILFAVLLNLKII